MHDRKKFRAVEMASWGWPKTGCTYFLDTVILFGILHSATIHQVGIASTMLHHRQPIAGSPHMWKKQLSALGESDPKITTLGSACLVRLEVHADGPYQGEEVPGRRCIPSGSASVTHPIFGSHPESGRFSRAQMSLELRVKLN